jgi:hypothetical protein
MDDQPKTAAGNFFNKKTRLYLILFASALLLGIISGRLILRDPQESSSWIAKNPGALSSTKFSILVAGVDDLSQHTVILEYAWWLSVDMGNNQVAVVSLYPGSSKDQNGAMLKPHSPLMVQTTDLESLKTFENLTSQVAEWDYSAYIDAYALSTLIELASGADPEALPEGISSLVAERAITWQEPGAASKFQLGLVEFICAHQLPFGSQDTMDVIQELTGTHIFTDIPKRQVGKLLKEFAGQAGQFECQVPTVE